jgi:hypothetical protein
LGRRRSIRIGIVAVALLVALGVTGVGYAVWSDTTFIDGETETGEWAAELTVTGLSPEASMSYALSDIDTEALPSPDTIKVIITDPEADGVYSCDFLISNLGTIPLKVGVFDVDPGNLPFGTTTGKSIESQLIETGLGVAGDGYATLPSDFEPDPEVEYYFTMNFVVVWWNE